MKKKGKTVFALIFSSLFLFPASISASTSAFEVDKIEEGTGSVQVFYEYGKENKIPLGEEVDGPQTGNTSNLNLYLTSFTSTLLFVLLFLYHREKERESN